MANASPPPFVLTVLDAAAREAGVDLALLRAVAHAESAFNPNAVSPAGAQGLMQLMPETARELGVTNPFDATQSARAAAKYIKRLLARYGGDLPNTLAAYNWGMGNVSKALESGKAFPAETRTYIARVMERLTLERRALGGGVGPFIQAAQAAAPSSTPDLPPSLARCAHCGSTFAAHGNADALRIMAAQLIAEARAIENKKGA
jgi:soluble lytic murein transglycosylase-like protein